MPETLTLYSSPYCPFAQRTVIALQEAKAEYTLYNIDLQNKPEWYAPKINPASKVPAIAYGGPQTDPANPSPESAKIAESLVLLEFIADLYPQSGLLPSNPVQRAHIRFAIDLFSTKVLPANFGTLWRGESPETLYSALLALQEHIALHAKPFLGGDRISIADAAFAPFIARLDSQLKNDTGGFGEGQGPKIHNEIFKSERFSVFQKYAQALLEREAVKSSFPEAEYLEAIKVRLADARKANS